MSQWEPPRFPGVLGRVGRAGWGLTELPVVLQSSCPAPLPTSAPSPAPPPRSPSPGRRRSRATATSRTTNSTTWRRGSTRSRYRAAAASQAALKGCTHLGKGLLFWQAESFSLRCGKRFKSEFQREMFVFGLGVKPVLLVWYLSTPSSFWGIPSYRERRRQRAATSLLSCSGADDMKDCTELWAGF